MYCAFSTQFHDYWPCLIGEAAMELPSGIVISSVSCTYSMLLFNLQFYTDKFDFFYHVYILVITGTKGDTYKQHKSFVHMPLYCSNLLFFNAKTLRIMILSWVQNEISIVLITSCIIINNFIKNKDPHLCGHPKNWRMTSFVVKKLLTEC